MKRLLATVCLLAACESERDGTVDPWWEECQDHWQDPIDCEDGDTACLDGEYENQWVVYCDCGEWKLAIDCAAYQGSCDEDADIVAWCYDVGGYDVVDDWFGTQGNPRCERWLESIEMLTYLCRTRIYETCAQQWCD